MYMYKKILISLLTLALAFPVAANPVDRQAAAKAAAGLLHKQVVDATPADFTECYLFVGADGHGFALLAADDCVPLLLGYSHTSTFPAGKLPHHIDTWLKAYQFDIAASRKAGVSTSKFNTLRDTTVGPLLTTTWNQSPWYNIQCPYSYSDSAYSVTGCVATATAQIMKYWNHPAVGRGQHSYNAGVYGLQTAVFDTTHYDWTHMPNALNHLSSDVELAAVAQLMYHIGVAVEMNYSPRSSGAYVSAYGDPSHPSSENALKNFFRYNQALFSASRDEFSNAEWDTLLTAELNATRPILFSGSDNDGGHAFVIDGYDTQGLYHVNWGWGGYCDGYYTFDNLSPTGSGIGGNPSNSYSYDNKILLHVFPASEAPSVTVSVVTSDSLIGTVSGSGTYSSYTSVTLHATANEGYRFHSWKNGNHANPITFSPNNDYSDTAIFVPIFGDTLGYCFSGYKGLWGEYGNNPPEWAIRIPANSVPARRQLNAVQFYGVSNADYSVKVYLGQNFNQLIFSTNYTTPYFGWYTVDLPEGVPLINNQPLWIVLTSRSYTNPAVYSSYSGNPDGTWYKRGGTTWEHLEDRNQYASWMIRAVLGELAKVDIDVQSGQPDRGSVSGAGSYYPGDTAVLTATPFDGFRFAGWSTGEHENPLYLRVTSAETIVASFVPNVAIDDVDGCPFGYTLDGLTVSVDNPTGLPAEIYDIEGRRLASFSSCHPSFALPAPGVYLLRCGPLVRKIVAIK